METLSDTLHRIYKGLFLGLQIHVWRRIHIRRDLHESISWGAAEEFLQCVDQKMPIFENPVPSEYDHSSSGD
jgi:hypothetical protein